MVEVALACWLPAKLQSDGSYAFIPGAWCDSTSHGKTIRELSQGGTFRRTKGGKHLEGTRVAELQRVPTDGAYSTMTSEFSADTYHAGASSACTTAKLTPPPLEEFADVVGCTTFIDRHLPVNDRTIALAGGAFDLRCLQIAAGQKVTFEGDFGKYGLRPGTPENSSAGSAANPLFYVLGGTSVTLEYPRPGDYPFHALAPGKPVGMVRVR